MITILQGLSGIAVILFICWLLSEQKKNFPWKMVITGMLLQIAMAMLVLRIPYGIELLGNAGQLITSFLGLAARGSEMLFGNIVKAEYRQTFGFQFAFTVLPAIIFFSSVMSVLYHLRIMQYIVKSMAWLMRRILGTTGIESLSACANIFLGQTEAPLLVKPYLNGAGRSELFTIMVGGFITIAGGVMAGYIQMGISASSLLTASIMAAPAGLFLSKIVIPAPKVQAENSDTLLVQPDTNTVLDAAAKGASDGMKLALNIAAMLIAFLAIIAGMNSILSWLQGLALSSWGMHIPGSLKEIFGLIFYPIALMIGVPQADAWNFGALIGTKISINEFLAYSDLSVMIQQNSISPKAAKMATFALCGFANFSSIAIQIGGIGAMAPARRHEIASLGPKAMLIGALGNLLTATLAGIFL
jgi:CNT family concentrative nucleoside transporter